MFIPQNTLLILVRSCLAGWSDISVLLNHLNYYYYLMKVFRDVSIIKMITIFNMLIKNAEMSFESLKQ